MLRLTIAAMLVLVQYQEMPVVRLTGIRPGPDGGQTPAQPPAPARPAPQTGTPLPPLPVTEIDAASAAAALDAPRRLTLTFVEPRPIEEVLRLVVSGTPFS